MSDPVFGREPVTLDSTSVAHTVPALSPESLHTRLRVHAAGLNTPLTLTELAQLHGSSMQGTLLVVLAAPCALPIPGLGNVLGAALMGLALATWRGSDCTSLPARVAGLALPAHWARRVLGALARFHDMASRWTRPRLVHLAVLRGRSWASAKVGLMGGLIFLPIPFGNVLPALAVVLLGMGLVYRDGLVVVLAAAVGLLASVYSMALGVGAWKWLLAPLLA